MPTSLIYIYIKKQTFQIGLLLHCFHGRQVKKKRLLCQNLLQTDTSRDQRRLPEKKYFLKLTFLESTWLGLYLTIIFMIESSAHYFLSPFFLYNYFQAFHHEVLLTILCLTTKINTKALIHNIIHQFANLHTSVIKIGHVTHNTHIPPPCSMNTFTHTNTHTQWNIKMSSTCLFCLANCLKN